jgi:HEAT repeat protein
VTIEASARARLWIVSIAVAVSFSAGCASASRAPASVGPTLEQKMASILRLEDARVLREPPPAIPPPEPRNRRERQAAAAAAASRPDLQKFIADPQARIRRRAALAIGRVGLREGVAPLTALLADADAEVRQMAAFALGVLGDPSAETALLKALEDPAPMVQGSAAEALGLLGDASAADAVGRMMSQVVASGALAQIPAAEEDLRRDTPASAFRLGVYALVRLKAYDALAAAVLDGSGQPRVRWWPVAFAFQRIEDKRAAPALIALAKESHPYAQAFAAKGLGALKDPASLPALIAAREQRSHGAD